jgi:phosphocarrier protein
MHEREFTVGLNGGLHAQASAKLVQTIAPFASQVQLHYKGREVNAKSIMGVMLLAAGQGATLRARADGPDAEAALDALGRFLGNGAG